MGSLVTTTEAEIGDVVVLEVTFGKQVRLQCPACKVYMRNGEEQVTCTRCGTIYSSEGGEWRVDERG